MTFQPEQLLYFIALISLLYIIYRVKIVKVKIAIIIFILVMFLINPFRNTVPTAVEAFEGTTQFSELPKKVEGKEYKPFSESSKSQLDILKRYNKENSHEIHN